MLGSRHNWSRRLRDDLEQEKLAFEVQRLSLRASAEEEKLELEVRELRDRIAGHEPHWRWRITQHVAIILGVMISVATYVKSVIDGERHDFQSAVAHLANGWEAGVTELMQHGDPGRTVLVNAVDLTGAPSGANWPPLTLSILRELGAYAESGKKFSPQQIEVLKGKVYEADLVVRESLEAVDRTLSRGERPDATVRRRLATQTCLTTRAIKLSGTRPPGWEQTLRRVSAATLTTGPC